MRIVNLGLPNAAAVVVEWTTDGGKNMHTHIIRYNDAAKGVPPWEFPGASMLEGDYVKFTIAADIHEGLT